VRSRGRRTMPRPPLACCRWAGRTAARPPVARPECRCRACHRTAPPSRSSRTGRWPRPRTGAGRCGSNVWSAASPPVRPPVAEHGIGLSASTAWFACSDSCHPVTLRTTGAIPWHRAAG
jgi:hypothetical protein